MAELDDKFKDLYEVLKEEKQKVPIVRPMTKFEFDIESIYIWYLFPYISLFCNYMDFNINIYFLCFRFNIRLCSNIFKSPTEYDYFNTPYITYSHNMYNYLHILTIGWLNWSYRICL